MKHKDVIGKCFVYSSKYILPQLMSPECPDLFIGLEILNMQLISLEGEWQREVIDGLYRLATPAEIVSLAEFLSAHGVCLKGLEEQK